MPYGNSEDRYERAHSYRLTAYSLFVDIHYSIHWFCEQKTKPRNEAPDLPVKMRMHYENKPIQIYWKFYHQKMKIFK